ncbi:MAG: tRNA threonylcarbamoyladenosine dehydratase [Candidatus Riflebacteria bacterium]|nr:tRNA threonylcarbamoyladenosine dehydratase [Candidatus Riflebacteria bacterium]
MHPSNTPGKRFYRTELLLGSQALNVLQQSHAAIFGLGGVGSFAAEGLARSGVGHFTLVDFDSIGITNINRQIMATTSTIGQDKVSAMADRIREINPDAVIRTSKIFFEKEQIQSIFSEPYNVVIDAIDSFNPKIALMVEAFNSGYFLLSAMGAASKINPTTIKAGDLSETEVCPFARRIRKRLRTYGIEKGIQVVFSTEKPKMPFHPDELPDDTHEVTFKKGRERMIQGSIAYIPAIFGMMLAGLAVQKITGKLSAVSDLENQPEILNGGEL